MAAPLLLFRALADDVRLRLLHAVVSAELSVAELVQVLKLPQSTVSRHLKPLRDAGLVETRREGTSVYYRRGELLADRELSAFLERRLRELGTAQRDAKAVRAVLDQRRKRSREFFEKVAGQYGERTQPGGGWQALAAGLAAGFAGQDVADLGSGEGDLVLLLARFARRVAAIDHSKAMLRHLRARAKAANQETRIETVEGDLERVPLPDAVFDAVFLSQALHHAARPAFAVAEAARLLRTGGRLIVLDLARHEQDWVRSEWADQWLGFEESELRTWMQAAGVATLGVESLSDTGSAKLPVVLAVGIKKSPSADEEN